MHVTANHSVFLWVWLYTTQIRKIYTFVKNLCNNCGLQLVPHLVPSPLKNTSTARPLSSSEYVKLDGMWLDWVSQNIINNKTQTYSFSICPCSISVPAFLSCPSLLFTLRPPLPFLRSANHQSIKYEVLFVSSHLSLSDTQEFPPPLPVFSRCEASLRRYNMGRHSAGHLLHRYAFSTAGSRTHYGLLQVCHISAVT